MYLQIRITAIDPQLASQPLHVKLYTGESVIVDREDYKLVSAYKWHMRGGYAVACKYDKDRYDKKDTYGVTISMHRLIMDGPKSKEIDHINGNKLDNRRSNLRLASHSQNVMNRAPKLGTKSGFQGVTLDPRSGAWQARITIGGRRLTIGSFKYARDAASAYAETALKTHGEYLHPKVLEVL